MNAVAHVIKFPKPFDVKEVGKSMYSDKFQQGYVMSSRLYRKEVWPFISDAARNVYAELENRINGHNKESDFVSYSQLQGSNLPGARQLGRKTVSAGLKELINYGVISIVGSGKQGMKSYRLNEISIKDRFTKGTSSPSTPVHKGNQSSSPSTPVTSSLGEHTIDTSLESLDNKKKNVPVDKSENDIFLDSIEYHHDNQNTYSLKELANVYTVKSDFITQAKAEDPTLSNEKILSELKNFAQWTTGKPKNTAQGWMNFWIYRIQKLNTAKAKPVTQAKTAPKTKKLSDSQIDMFSKKLCNHIDFASMYSNVGETQKQFESRIAEKLREPQKIQDWASYLRDVGFIWKLEDLAL